MRYAIAAGLALLLSATTAGAYTAEELVAKNLEAHGGIDKIHALKSLRLEGKLIFGGAFELQATSLYKAPDKLRRDATCRA